MEYYVRRCSTVTIAVSIAPGAGIVFGTGATSSVSISVTLAVGGAV